MIIIIALMWGTFLLVFSVGKASLCLFCFVVLSYCFLLLFLLFLGDFFLWL